MGPIDRPWTGALAAEEAAPVLGSEGRVFAAVTARVGGVDHRVFAHLPDNLGAMYALSLRHGRKTFLVYEDEAYTFEHAHRRVTALSHHLVHEYGVRPGDRIALAMRNYPEWCFTYMAATAVGAVAVPLNAWWQGSELAYGIRDSGAGLAVVDQERLQRLLPHVDRLGLKLLLARGVGAPAPGVAPLGPLLEGEHAMPVVAVCPDDDATIMYTSGSTGQPKGVVSTHRAVLSAVMTWEFFAYARHLFEASAAERGVIVRWAEQGAAALAGAPFELPDSAMLITVPLFHVTGCNVQFLPALRTGRKLVMMYKWDPERALELIERERVTDFNGVPTMSWELINSPDYDKRDTSSLRSLSAGGASRPPEHVGKIKEKARGAMPSTGYGMTETNSLGTAIGGDEYAARPSSVGRALPPLVSIKVVDEDGRELPRGQEGEICIKSVTNLRCYWNRPQETAATLRDGWVHTGDLGRIDGEGFLFITGRAKDIVIRGGENVSCAEVEYALYEHPAVFEAAVYGVPDERLGEALAATVMLGQGQDASADELKAHVADRLARFKVPTHLFVQREQLPRIASGKIDKLSLRAQTEARLRSAPATAKRRAASSR